MYCSACGHGNQTDAAFCAECGRFLTVEVAPIMERETSPIVQDQFNRYRQYSGFWVRLLALIVDLVALTIVFAVFNSFGFLLLDTMPFIIQTIFNTPLVYPFYFWIFTGLSGQTPGKMLLGIKVIDREGNPPGLVKAALREFVGKFLSSIVFCLGYFLVGLDDRKQGWHDKVAQTFVVPVAR